MRVFVGMETSGMVRRAFAARGHDVISCDLLPSVDGSERHLVGDVFSILEYLNYSEWWPNLAVFHPTCTFLTYAAEWAYGDGPYHQKLKPGTLVGAERRAAREAAIADVLRIAALPIRMKCIENPRGVLQVVWRKPTQVIQPWQFGEDASKETCLWLDNLRPLVPTKLVSPPRLVADAPYPGRGKWTVAGRYANQTDSGQNALPPSDDRWADRSATYPGIAAAMAEQWG
jgi:hypothetical protein